MLKITEVISKCYLIFLFSLIFLFQTQFAQDSAGLFTHLKENDIKDNQIVKDKISQILQKDNIEKYYFVSIKDINAFPDMKNLKFNFYEKTIEMKVKRTKKYKDDKYNMSAENDEYGYAVITQCENGILGFIQSRSEGYRIEPLADGIHVIMKLDMKKLALREKKFIDYQENPILAKIAQYTYSTETTYVINLIIAYTLDAKNDCPTNIRDYAREAVWAAEQTYANSGINISFNLVLLYMTDYTESPDMQTDLNYFKGMNDPYMPEIHTYLGQYSADVCGLMVANKLPGQPNGIAGIIGAMEPQDAFFIVNYDAASSQWSLAHEIGHLIGARHQNETDKGKWPLEYAHGWYKNGPYNDPYSGWRTVMAIMDGGYSTSYIRIPYYSDPRVIYNGFKRGDSTIADNVRALNERARIISNLFKRKPETQTSTDNALKFNLIQNYPNPFNPNTTISYSLSVQSIVEVKIYNVMGNEIRTFNLNMKQPGYHSLQWDGKNSNNENVASGTYIYRLKAVSFRDGKIFEKSAKMMLVK